MAILRKDDGATPTDVTSISDGAPQNGLDPIEWPNFGAPETLTVHGR
jgi:hypothetical protein